MSSSWQNLEETLIDDCSLGSMLRLGRILQPLFYLLFVSLLEIGEMYHFNLVQPMFDTTNQVSI